MGFLPFAPALADKEIEEAGFQNISKKLLGILRHSNPFAVAPLFEYWAPAGKLHKVLRTACRNGGLEPPSKTTLVRTAVGSDGAQLFQMIATPLKPGGPKASGGDSGGSDPSAEFATWIRASPLAGTHSIAPDGGKAIQPPQPAKQHQQQQWGAQKSTWKAKEQQQQGGKWGASTAWGQQEQWKEHQ